MKLHSIELTNFKGVAHRRIEFPHTGVTVLEGHNESGKSSVIEALDLLLEKLHTSKDKDTRAARPEGRDVAVEVQAELTLAGERLVYRKRWWKNPGAELEFRTGPRAGRTSTGREAHEAVSELLDRSDRTLWRALRLLQSAPRSEDFKGSAGLRKALEAGGNAAADDSTALTVLESARAERAKYFTDTGKEKADTSALRRRHEQAAARLRGAERGLEHIAQAVETYDRAAANARVARETLERARADLVGAEEQEAQVRQLQEQRQQATLAVEQAAARVQRSQQDLTARTDLVTQATQAEVKVHELQELVAEHTQAHQDHHSNATDARAALAVARETEQTARDVERQARNAERRAGQTARLAELQSVIKQLDDAQSEAAALAEHEPGGVTAEDVEGIDRAQRAVELAHSQLDAGSAQVTVSALQPDLAVEIDGTSTTVDPERPWQQPATEQIMIELAGQLRVVVEPEGGLSQRQARVRAAQDHLDSLLAAAGVPTLLQAQEALEGDRIHAQQLASWQERKALILSGHQEHTLREEAVTLEAAVAAVSDESSDPLRTPAELQDAVTAAERDLERAQDARTRGEQVLTELDRHAQNSQLALTQSGAQLDGARQNHQALQRRLAEARDKYSDEALESLHTTQTQRLEQAQAHLHIVEATWVSQDAESVLQQANGHRTRVENARQRQEQARSEQARAEGALEGLNRDAVQREFDTSLTELRAVTTQLNAHLRRASAAQLLAQLLESFQAQAHQRYNAPFRQQLEHLGRAVFGPTFEVELSDDLTITRRKLHGTWLEVSALSTGAQEQLDVLIRLAVASLVDPEDAVPVVLDDTLGHSDPHRLISMAGALESVGSRAQVVLLTATPDRFAGLRAAKTVRIQEGA